MSTQEKRRTRRAPVESSGLAVIDEGQLALRTRNVSLGGSMVHVDREPGIAIGARLQVWLDSLGFGAQARLRWTDPDPAGGMLMGLEFEHLEFAHHTPTQ